MLKIILVTILMLLTTQANSTGSYHHYTISQVENAKHGNLTSYKIDITTNGKHVWTITTDQLPITEQTCNKESIDLCDDTYQELYHGGCHHPCIVYGPQPLSFDKKNNKLYLIANTTAAGSGGSLYFTFSADIPTKTIQYLGTRLNPLNSTN